MFLLLQKLFEPFEGKKLWGPLDFLFPNVLEHEVHADRQVMGLQNGLLLHHMKGKNSTCHMIPFSSFIHVCTNTCTCTCTYASKYM